MGRKERRACGISFRGHKRNVVLASRTRDGVIVGRRLNYTFIQAAACGCIWHHGLHLKMESIL